MKSRAQQNRIVVAIKLIHTVVWIFMVACIVAIPIAGGLHNFRLAAILVAIVLIECLVLAINRCRCPLTDLAARFTPEVTPNFDIYLPNWLARRNKLIFGTLFLAGGLLTLCEWLLFTH
jgi:hypothetical protein